MEWGSDDIQVHKIKTAHVGSGGWEGWAQVEIMFLLNSGREDSCYVDDPTLRADIVLTPTGSGHSQFAVPYVNHECVVLELKCESYMNALHFKDEVKKDLQKIRGKNIKDRLLHGGCNVYSLAFSMTKEGDVAMESLGMELFHMSDLRKQPPFRLWWSVRQIPPKGKH